MEAPLSGGGTIGREGAMKRGDLVILDGDDTLWRTQEVYDAAKARFASLLAEDGLIDPDPITVLDRIDAEAVDTGAFTVNRFIDSMLRTYRVLAEAAKRHPVEHTEKKIRLLGEPLLGDYQLYADTLDVLEELAPRIRLVLATKGQPDLQGQKVTRLGLARFFDRIYFLERKTEQEYLAILSAYSVRVDRVWAVGNSVRSDINPALELGIRAILIKRPTWRYEEAKLRSGDVTIVDSLSAACVAILTSETPVAASARPQ